MPTVSIVVPVYKAEKRWTLCRELYSPRPFPTLSFCLLTMPALTAAADVRCMGRKRPRIHALHPAKTGPGPSGARNAGLDAAAAPWITMVDSDDTVATGPAGNTFWQVQSAPARSWCFATVAP